MKRPAGAGGKGVWWSKLAASLGTAVCSSSKAYAGQMVASWEASWRESWSGSHVSRYFFLIMNWCNK